jgi:hypothetical protein
MAPMPKKAFDRPRINAADTLSQWVLSSPLLALLHQFDEIPKSARLAHAETAARNDQNDRKSWAGTAHLASGH